QVQARYRMGAHGRVRGRSAPDRRLLPAALGAVRRRNGRVDGESVTDPRIPFLSLTPAADGAAVRQAIERVIARGWFVLGPEVEAFEGEFAAASGASNAVGVGSGTDALSLILRALGIGRGDDVITTPLSAAYTALAILSAGARPVFADIDPSRLTIDPDQIARLIGPATRAILPVHLYGQPAEMSAIEPLASRHS